MDAPRRWNVKLSRDLHQRGAVVRGMRLTSITLFICVGSLWISRWRDFTRFDQRSNHSTIFSTFLKARWRLTFDWRISFASESDILYSTLIWIFMGVWKRRDKKEMKEYATTIENLSTVERLTVPWRRWFLGYLSETYINCKQRIRIRFGLGVILFGCLVRADNQWQRYHRRTARGRIQWLVSVVFREHLGN